MERRSECQGQAEDMPDEGRKLMTLKHGLGNATAAWNGVGSFIRSSAELVHVSEYGRTGKPGLSKARNGLAGAGRPSF